MDDHPYEPDAETRKIIRQIHDNAIRSIEQAMMLHGVGKDHIAFVTRVDGSRPNCSRL